MRRSRIQIVFEYPIAGYLGNALIITSLSVEVASLVMYSGILTSDAWAFAGIYLKQPFLVVDQAAST